MKKYLVIILVLIAIVANGQIEEDKQMHFMAGSLASGFGYTYVFEKTQDKKKATLAGIGLALLAGTIKETIDSQQKNDKFDIGDLAATTLGGITISVTINLIKNDRNNKKIRKRRLGLSLGKN
tara:strand:- start:1422 stop:1790 length:369 start_codon:yes stop_codon:yes gene_type:complete